MTVDKEDQTPFPLYVQPDAAYTLHISPFPQFVQLPSEIQFHILTFCSAPTLFQIMRVSSVLRIEAAKLFWADPNTYYFIECSWLLAGGYPGNTNYDLSFFCNVQNIEVEYGHDAHCKLNPIQDDMDIPRDLILDFWTTLRSRFRRVKRVVINTPRLTSMGGVIPRCVQVLIESCPPEIDVSAFFLEGEHACVKNETVALPTFKYQRTFYRPTPNGELRKVTLLWDRNTILMPIKLFSGPVGEFERLSCRMKRIELQENALGPLVIEALGRHHFDEGKQEHFSCPMAGCNVHFKMAGQWTIHALETHYAYSINPKARIDIDMLPESWRKNFEGHKNDLEKKKRELFRAFRKIYDAWNEEGGEKRRKMEHEWMDQLENDELWVTGRDAGESELFSMFTMCMEQELDADAFG